jgi:hypothetical protein
MYLSTSNYRHLGKLTSLNTATAREIATKQLLQINQSRRIELNISLAEIENGEKDQMNRI